MMLDMSRALTGNVSAEFTEYTFEANHELVRSAHRQTPFLQDTDDKWMEHFARSPESTVCKVRSTTR
jgi:hypothetical protein